MTQQPVFEEDEDRLQTQLSEHWDWFNKGITHEYKAEIKKRRRKSKRDEGQKILKFALSSEFLSAIEDSKKEKTFDKMLASVSYDQLLNLQSAVAN